MIVKIFIFVSGLLWLTAPVSAVKILRGPLPVVGQVKPLEQSTSKDPAEAEIWIKADQQFRASYYYSRYLVSGLQGRFTEASILLRQAAESDPDSLALKRELAENYAVMGQAQAARIEFEKAVALDPQDFELRNKLAHLLVSLGKLEDARAQYLAYLKINPGHRASLHALAALEAAEGKTKEALQDLKKILQAYPDSVSDLELYADLLGSRKEGDAEEIFLEAEKAWLNLLQIKPEHVNGWYRLALLYEDHKLPMKAEQIFLKGLNQSPDNFLLLDGLARFYYRQDRYNDSERAFNVNHLANPSDVQSLLFLGMSRLQLEKYTLAEQDFLKAAEIEQKDSALRLYGLGLALAGQKKFDQAEPVFLKLIDQFPKAVSGYTQLALLYDKKEKGAETRKILRRGIKENPSQSDLYLLLAAAYMDQKDFKRAEKNLLEGLTESKKKSALRFQLATLYDKTDRFDKAEQELKKLIAADPTNAQALNYLAYSWAERGLKFKEAEALALQALKVEPENLYYLDSLGWILFKQGRYQEAAVKLQAAATGLEGKWSKEDAVILDHLGDALSHLGRREEAAKRYQAALKLRPQDADIRKKVGSAAAAHSVSKD